MLKEGPQAQQQLEVTLKTTPIYSMDAIINVMLKMHHHLLEYFNPESSFFQFLIRKHGYCSIGFKFAHAMAIYLPDTKGHPTYTKTIRELYIDALERMPETNGFSMLQYLRHSNRKLYYFLKQHIYILDGLYLEYLDDKRQAKEQRRLETLLRQEKVQLETNAHEKETLDIDRVSPQSKSIMRRRYPPPDDFLFSPEEYFLEEKQENATNCFMVAFKALCHKFSTLTFCTNDQQKIKALDAEWVDNEQRDKTKVSF